METLTILEIRALEAKVGATLPGLYRNLLCEIGHGTTRSGKQIYYPGEIQAVCTPLFDDSSKLFAPYFPFGCDNNRKELWVIDGDLELAATIWHETVPEDWPDVSWMEYDRWVNTYIPFLDSEL